MKPLTVVLLTAGTVGAGAFLFFYLKNKRDRKKEEEAAKKQTGEQNVSGLDVTPDYLTALNEGYLAPSVEDWDRLQTTYPSSPNQSSNDPFAELSDEEFFDLFSYQI